MFKTQQESLCGWDREQQERPTRPCRASWAIYKVYLCVELKRVMRSQDLSVPPANMLGSQSFFPLRYNGKPLEGLEQGIMSCS